MMKEFGLPVALFLANVLNLARGQFVCDSTVTGREGNLTTPTYTRSMNYTVCVVAPSGYFSDISVTLNISDSVDCNEARLNIYERPSNKTFTYKTSLCGEEDLRYVGLGWAVQLVTSKSVQFVPSFGFYVAWKTVKTHECTHENVIDQSSSGVVTSENYPERYFDHQQCLYTIKTPLEKYTLWLNVTHFSLEESDDCLSDYVLIYSSANNKGERICGAKTPGVIKSPSNRLTVEFHTDKHRGSSGFRAVYFSAREFNFTAISGTVMSLGYPVANLGTQSYFYVTPPHGKYTAFETHFIHVPSAGQTDCRNSNVFRIYSLIGEYQLGVCGMWNNTGVRLQQGVMVLLRTDVNLRTAAGIGFRSTYRTIDTDVCVEDYVFTDKFSWFTSPNFPLKYYNDKTCRYRIEAPRDHYVTLEFTTFYVEGFGCHYDYVKIYDGNATDSLLLITLCGFNSTLPPVVSSDNAMLVVFNADYAYGYPGFNATYHSDPKASTATTTTTTEKTRTTRTTTTTPETTITTPDTSTTTVNNTNTTSSSTTTQAIRSIYCGFFTTDIIKIFIVGLCFVLFGIDI